MKEVESSAAKLGINLATVKTSTADDIGPAMRTFVGKRVSIVLVLRDALFFAIRQKIAAFALASRIPTI